LSRSDARSSGAGPNGPATSSTIELDFAAVHPGDDQYKPAVQHIVFDQIANQRLGTKSIALTATSDATMPVAFYVREGPALITGNTLTFTPIPPRTKFPVKVTIVAWQYGRAAKPAVQTAQPVERAFYIIK